MKVLFLDRDGIINIERGEYTWNKEDFVFTENLFPFLKFFTQSNYKIIVITNQGGIDKGLYSKTEVEELHKWMSEEFQRNGIELLDIYYCPHHDIIQKCLCRKPKSLLFEKCLSRYNIEKENSIMLGDSQRDIDAAQRVGIKGHLFESNSNWKDIDARTLIPG